LEFKALALDIILKRTLIMSTKVNNPIARAPILKKGGAHVKSKSSQRTQVKNDLKRAVNEWKIGKSII
jgi:hypothetical protein